MADAPKLSQEELFSMLIFNFEQSAMIAMGKLKHPVTGKVERHLQDAGISIDMLQMLADTTQGNLDEPLARKLQQVLTMLRLNFVDEQQKSTAAETGDTTDDHEAAAPGAEVSADVADTPENSDSADSD